MKAQSIPVVAPPEHLSEKARQLWTELTATEVDTTARQALLLAGLEALDRATEARLAIKEQGLVNTTESTKAVHVNPLLKVERESKALFSKIWAQLGLAMRGPSPW
jgi:P27 family predicted phage terminase small subunit